LIVADIVGETGPRRRVIGAVDGMDERQMTLGDLTRKISATPFKKF
jgi:hypothetical protein